MILHGVYNDVYWTAQLKFVDHKPYFDVNTYKPFTNTGSFTRVVKRVMGTHGLSIDDLYTVDVPEAITLHSIKRKFSMHKSTNAITSFDGTEHDFLSNFHPCIMEFEGIVYPTTEHAFQAMKSLDNEVRLKIASMSTPGKAKRMGREIALRPDWEYIKDEVMYQVCKIKFSQPGFTKQLLATGDAELVEGNGWNDRYWGVDAVTGVGENKLGKILMRIRSELLEKVPVTAS